MKKMKPRAADYQAQLESAYQRHCSLLPALLAGDEGTLDHFAWSEDALWALVQAIATDSLPTRDDVALSHQAYWRPLRRVARERPEWIINLLCTPGLKSHYPDLCLQLLDSLQFATHTASVLHFLRRLIYRQLSGSALWRERALSLLVKHQPVDLDSLLAHVSRHDPCQSVRNTAREHRHWLNQHPAPVQADLDMLRDWLGAPESWLDPPSSFMACP